MSDKKGRGGEVETREMRKTHRERGSCFNKIVTNLLQWMREKETIALGRL